MRFTAMTFNVRGSFHEDGANDWDQWRDLNLRTLLRHAPDIVGFQEAQSGNLNAYDSVLMDYESEHGPVAVRTTDRFQHVRIYWKRARFTKAAAGGFYLSETPEAWSLSWGSTLVRSATWVRLRDSSTGGECLVLNTHFPHEPDSDRARTECARLIVERLEVLGQNKMPALILGDFNAAPGSDAYRIFTDAGYHDAHLAAGGDETVNTFHGFQGMAFPRRGIRIDWIMVHPRQRTLAVSQCVTLTDAEPPLYPSDHYPVMAKLELT
ncbi:MAG: endonuclease/exonuclease/phosphatase family protein [Chloroflexi bacterium]|nr:endonuclease/exonuclease/phosphatase family protein [Chloroflexota bacterium]